MRNILTLLSLFILSFSTVIHARAKKDGRIHERIQRSIQDQSPRLRDHSPFKNRIQKKVHNINGAGFKMKAANLHRIIDERPEFLDMKIPIPNEEVRVLVYKSEVTSQNFKVRTKSGRSSLLSAEGGYYRGVVVDFNGKPISDSLVSLNINEDDFSGTVKVGGQVYDIGRRNIQNGEEEYFSHDANSIPTDGHKLCGEEEGSADLNNVPSDITPPSYTSQSSNPQNWPDLSSKVVTVYLEAGYNLYQHKGSSVANTVNYLTGLFNQVAALYENEGITLQISEIMVWDTPEPYGTASAMVPTSTLLNSFRNYLGNQFDGHLAHFVTPTTSGGRASLASACGKTGYAVSGIYPSYQSISTYSWSVNVMAHEIGHNLGAEHTHSGAWSGGPIDGCYAPETGGYAPGPMPTNGGTIMSYCHLKQNIGINFAHGFGEQPGNFLRRSVENAYCLGGPGKDYTPPYAPIISSALPSTISGTVNVSSSFALGNVKYELYIGDTVVATKTSSPYTLTWNSTTVPNGNYILRVRAYDFAGNSSFSQNKNITVSNSGSNPPVLPFAIASSVVEQNLAASDSTKRNWIKLTFSPDLSGKTLSFAAKAAGGASWTPKSGSSIEKVSTNVYKVFVDSPNKAYEVQATCNNCSPVASVTKSFTTLPTTPVPMAFAISSSVVEQNLSASDSKKRNWIRLNFSPDLTGKTLTFAGKAAGGSSWSVKSGASIEKVSTNVYKVFFDSPNKAYEVQATCTNCTPVATVSKTFTTLPATSVPVVFSISSHALGKNANAASGKKYWIDLTLASDLTGKSLTFAGKAASSTTWSPKSGTSLIKISTNVYRVYFNSGNTLYDVQANCSNCSQTSDVLRFTSLP